MVEATIMALIYLALAVLVVYVVLWVVEQLGISLPPQVVKIIWVVVALIALLVILRTLLPAAGIHLR